MYLFPDIPSSTAPMILKISTEIFQKFVRIFSILPPMIFEDFFISNVQNGTEMWRKDCLPVYLPIYERFVIHIIRINQSECSPFITSDGKSIDTSSVVSIPHHNTFDTFNTWKTPRK